MISALKQLRTDFRIKIGYGAAFVLLLISYILTWYANQQLAIQSRLVIHSNAIISHMEGLASYMKDAETGVRGFALVKDPSFLDPYYKSKNAIDSTFRLLKAETIDNTDQQILLYTAKKYIDEKYDILDAGKDYYATHVFKADDRIQLASAFRGKVLMDSVRTIIGLMKIKEQDLLAVRTKELKEKSVSMNVIIVTSLILAFLFATFGFVTYMRENEARKSADGQVLGYQHELQKRIEELDTANKELIQMRRTEKFAATGRIARTIAHEVRNPLTNIDLAVSQLKSEMPEVNDNSGILFDMVNRNSKRINQLITELLNTTRFVELNFQKVSVNQLLNETLELAKDRIALHHIYIEKNYHTSAGCDILVDAEKIKIAFLNIIVNAMEAMENNGGILKITTKEEGSKCIIEISDNGIGMDAVALEKLFEPYFTTKSSGNGLGLANTQNIILNHKGTIYVESKSGEGTVFTIKFDLAGNVASV